MSQILSMLRGLVHQKRNGTHVTFLIFWRLFLVAKPRDLQTTGMGEGQGCWEAVVLSLLLSSSFLLFHPDSTLPGPFSPSPNVHYSFKWPEKWTKGLGKKVPEISLTTLEKILSHLLITSTKKRVSGLHKNKLFFAKTFILQEKFKKFKRHLWAEDKGHHLK